MLKVQEILKATNGDLINGNLNKLISSYKINSREIKNGDFFIPIIGEKVNGHKFIFDTVNRGCIGFFINNDEAEKINLQEIIKVNHNIVIIKVEDTEKALYNIGLYNRQKHMNIEAIAITGSVGKTSTRELIASVLSQNNKLLVSQKNMNSYIGTPLMTLLLEKQELAVLEAGIDFVGEMDLIGDLIKPEIAVITNIGVSHIGKLGNQENIYKEKVKIANKLVGKKILLLNSEDEYLSRYQNSNINIRYYNINEAQNIVIKDNSIEFDIKIYNNIEHIIINCIGNHNILNAIVAIRIGEIYNIPKENIILGIKKYKNYSRRMEKIELNKFTIIDDTYNASPSSTRSGLISVNHFNNKRKIAVLADILELGKYSKEIHARLGEVFRHIHYDIIIAFGENMKDLVHIAKNYVKEIYYFNTSQEAEEKLREIIKMNDVIYFKGSNAMNVNMIVENLKRDFMN